MDKELWQHIHDLFAAALDRPDGRPLNQLVESAGLPFPRRLALSIGLEPGGECAADADLVLSRPGMGEASMPRATPDPAAACDLGQPGFPEARDRLSWPRSAGPPPAGLDSRVPVYYNTNTAGWKTGGKEGA